MRPPSRWVRSTRSKRTNKPTVSSDSLFSLNFNSTIHRFLLAYPTSKQTTNSSSTIYSQRNSPQRTQARKQSAAQRTFREQTAHSPSCNPQESPESAPQSPRLARSWFYTPAASIIETIYRYYAAKQQERRLDEVVSEIRGREEIEHELKQQNIGNARILGGLNGITNSEEDKRSAFAFGFAWECPSKWCGRSTQCREASPLSSPGRNPTHRESNIPARNKRRPVPRRFDRTKC